MISYIDSMINIFNIYGRTKRLNFFIALIVTSIIESILWWLGSLSIIGFVCTIIAKIYTFIFGISIFTMTMRRLNDAGFSKWFALLHFVPGAGQIALFVLCLFPSK
ncbi:MAG: DUF805 domain-containing protein [Clostridia bacterium]|nr:DUF805 domain-containing protein [Clostridia bacterium]